MRPSQFMVRTLRALMSDVDDPCLTCPGHSRVLGDESQEGTVIRFPFLSSRKSNFHVVKTPEVWGGRHGRSSPSQTKVLGVLSFSSGGNTIAGRSLGLWSRRSWRSRRSVHDLRTTERKLGFGSWVILSDSKCNRHGEPISACQREISWPSGGSAVFEHYCAVTSWQCGCIVPESQTDHGCRCGEQCTSRRLFS